MCRLPAPVLLCALSVACGPLADGELVGLDAYEPPGGQYRIHYLSPPWELFETNGAFARFIVESNASAFGGVGPDVVPPKYDLRVRPRSGSARNRARAAQTAATRQGHLLVRPAMPLEDDGVRVGWDVLFDIETAPLRHFRTVYLDRDVGGVIELAFEANPPLDSREVDAMIFDVEVDPGDP